MCYLTVILIITISIIRISSNTLSGNSKPINYDLWLTIDIDRLTFNGTVDITLEVVKPTNSIEVNFEIPDYVTFNKFVDGQRSIELETTIAQAPQIQYKFTEVLAKKEYVLSLSFHGNINDDLKGLYRSNYIDSTGTKRYVATTYLAMIYARMVFPCYDEPHYKSTFNIHIAHHSKYMALSNMGQIGDIPAPNAEGFVETSFEQTPSMSTYLVAFIVSDLEKSKSGGTFNIYSQVDKLNQTEYAASYGKTILTALETYTDSSYQLPKMDFVVIDGFWGAMENWGLITFEPAVLLYSDKSTTKELESISGMISHELVHQWFGNQVTCYWWSAYWLNEGFATYYTEYISDIVDPSWRLMDKFLVEVVHKSMILDDDVDVRAMSSDVITDEQINSIYSFVNYQKAASVIRMIQSVVTENVFQKSSRSYLKDRKFKVATPNDLYTHIQDALDIERPVDGNSITNIAEIFDSWTTTSGYPFINVVRNYSTGIVTVSQRRFTRTREVRKEKYYVPLNFAMKNTSEFLDTRATHWLKPTDINVEIAFDVDSPDDWIIFNKQQTAYYRVDYDYRNWKLIINELNGTNFNKIHPSNRAQLIDDVYNLGVFGYIHFNYTLDLLKYVKQETDVIPLTAAFKVLKNLSIKLRHESNEKIQKFVWESIEANYKKFALLNYFPRDTHVNKLLRMDVVELACSFGLESCLNDAKIITFESGDVRTAIYCGAMKAKNPVVIHAEYINRLTVLLSSPISRRDNLGEIRAVISGFGCSSEPEILTNTLKLSLGNSLKFEPEDRNKLFEAVVKGSVLGTSMALDFLDGNLPEIRKYYKSIPAVFSVFNWYIGTNTLWAKYMQISFDHFTNLTTEEKDVIEKVGNVAIDDIAWSWSNSKTIEIWLDDYYGHGAGHLFKSSFALIISIFILIKVIE